MQFKRCHIVLRFIKPALDSVTERVRVNMNRCNFYPFIKEGPGLKVGV